MTLNLSLPNVCLAKISGRPRLFVQDEFEQCASDKKLSREFWEFVSEVEKYSPYLKKIISKEKDWLKAVIDLPIEIILDALLRDIRSSNSKWIVENCRKAKRRGFLITALFDLAGFLSLEKVSHILTVVADEILGALTNEVMNPRLIGKFDSKPISYNSNISTNAGRPNEIKSRGDKFFVLAMGKMGAHELNYSSDIDIIFFLSQSNSHFGQRTNERREYIIKARKLIKILSNLTADDFIYRTDLRLRPDPASTPIVVSTDFAATYYQNLGRTWERMAFIKARPVAGNISGAKKFLETLESFIWRKHFDYASIEDVKNLREKMKLDSTSINLEALGGYNIKMGLGGIRDIELFTQTYQLIVGGRQIELRQQSTVVTLNTLAKMKWLRRKQSEELIDAYIFFRNVENRLQMINNTQTQILPSENSVSFTELSILLGFEEAILFKKKLKDYLLYVKALTEDFFTNLKFRGVGKNIEELATPSTPKDISRDKDLIILNPELSQRFDHVRELPIFRTARALKSFEALIPTLNDIVSHSINPSDSFLQFSNFLKELSSGFQLFPLLENNPGIINTLIKICQSSDSIAKLLAKDIALFDLLIAEDFLKFIDSRDAARSNIKLRIKRGSDYEFTLNELRKFAKERKFQICVHLILEKINPLQAAEFFSDTAEICIGLLCPLIKKNLLRRYGSPAKYLPCILGMGKLGSKEMNFYSDLDLILIYDSQARYNAGNKNYGSLSAYFAKFTQTLVSAFTSLTEEGRLYQVDMRLRPSGKQGPVATALSAFDSYQREKAWVWEHMALSRGRIIAGDTSIKREVLGIFDKVFGQGGHSKQTIKTQTLKMRHSLRTNFPSAFTPPEIKFGRGGMQELELLVQMGFLLTDLRYESNQQSPHHLIKRLSDQDFFTKDETYNLLLIHNLYFNFQQTYCIFTVKKSEEEKLSDVGFRHLLASISDLKIRNDIACVADLNEVLIEKADFVGNLFDRKLN